MGKQRRKKTKRTRKAETGRPRQSVAASDADAGEPQASAGADSPESRKGHGAEQPGQRGAKRAGWIRRKGPVFQFVVLFGLILGAFHLIRSTSFVMDTVWPAHLRFVTQASGAVLRLFEDSLRVSGYSITSPRYQLTIARGCDAFEPCALFVAGVLAFPAPWVSKLPGAVIGTLLIMVMNLVRIVTLFYIGAFWPRAFEIMHVDVWQTLFILLAIFFWTVWALRATRVGSPKREKADAVH
ncbi:MAG: archaeosortase/exosortase family protein [Phycisphaerae bacterium]